MKPKNTDKMTKLEDEMTIMKTQVKHVKFIVISGQVTWIEPKTLKKGYPFGHAQYY